MVSAPVPVAALGTQVEQQRGLCSTGIYRCTVTKASFTYARIALMALCYELDNSMPDVPYRTHIH